MLLNYLTERPAFLPAIDLVPIHEIEERLDIVQEVVRLTQNFDPDWHLTAMNLSVFLMIPLETLRVLKHNMATTPAESLLFELDSIHHLTVHCTVPLVFKYAWTVN
jgi:hypothetical protein